MLNNNYFTFQSSAFAIIILGTYPLFDNNVQWQFQKSDVEIITNFVCFFGFSQ